MTDKKYPEPTVGAFILNDEGELFLLKTHKWKDKYIIPGGHVELGEKMEDALKREIKEETNLDIDDLKFMTVMEHIFGDEFHKKKHFIWLTFQCRTNTKNVVLNEEGQDYIWVNPTEALKIQTDSFTKALIEYYLEKNGKKRLL